MVRRVLQENKVPGTSMVTRATAAPNLAPTGSAARFLGESQVNSSLPCQIRFEQHRERQGCLKSQRGEYGRNGKHTAAVSTHRLWTLAGES